MKKTAFLPALLAALPLLATAQNATQDSLLRKGDLVGGRPHASVPRTAAASRSAAGAGASAANADPVLTRLLHESIDIGRVPASQLSDLYKHFLEATRAQHREWTDRDWQDAAAALSRLNARYEAVRLELPLDQRINVRSYQGEFRSFEGARRVKEQLDK